MRFLFRDFSTQRKFAVLLVIFMIVPYLAVSLITYRQLRSNSLRDEYDRQTQVLDLANRLVDLQLLEYERVIHSIYGYQTILPIIALPENEVRTLHHERVVNTLRTIFSQSNYVNSAYVFGANGAEFFTDSFSMGAYSDVYYADPQLERIILDQPHGITWFPSFYIPQKTKQEPVGPVFSCAMRVYDIVNSLDFCGIFVLNLNTELFDNLFADILPGEDAMLLISDNQGNVIWCNQNPWVRPADGLSPELFTVIQEHQNSFVETRYEDREYVVSSKRSEYNDWLYISMTPRLTVLRSQEWVVTLVFTQVVIMLCMMGAGAALIKRYVSDPLRKITVLMGFDRQEREAMRLNIPDDQADEIGQLYRSFNKLDARVAELLQESVEAEKRVNDYRMKILQAQIHPHFIYNTLDMIRWTAIEDEQEEIASLILSLSNILRYSVSKNAEIVTLREEFQCLRDYVVLYRVRYENLFEISWDIREEVMEYRTFRMLLQPLLENVMVHGFRDRSSGGKVHVCGRLEGGNAVVKIIDNGKGMDEKRLFYALSQQSDGIGVSNINERLILMYGREYAMRIESAPGGGTTVCITVPPSLAGEERPC